MKIFFTFVSLTLSTIGLLFSVYTNYEIYELISQKGIDLNFNPMLVVNNNLISQLGISLVALAFAILAALKKQPLAFLAMSIAFINWIFVFLPVWIVMFLK